MGNKFAICFPSGDGNMICQHWNGSWIVFPIGKGRKKDKSSPKGEDESSDKPE